MSFGGGGGGSPARSGAYTPPAEIDKIWAKQRDMNAATAAGFTKDSAGTTNPQLFKTVQTGPSSMDRSMASQMRSPGADQLQATPYGSQVQTFTNPWYEPKDNTDTFETSTTVIPTGAQVTTKRLPERQPAKRSGASAAGASSLLSSASGGGLKSLLGE